MVIFINYRRDDSLAITGRIDDHLRGEFENVYRDIDSIPLGTDFIAHIGAELDKCEVFLAVIGDGWLCERLYEEDDLVRVEIEIALSRGIPVIPVFVDGGKLPKKSELPVSIQRLTTRNGISIDSGGLFQEQIKRLIDGIKALSRVPVAQNNGGVPGVPLRIQGEQPKQVNSMPGDIELVLIPQGTFTMGSADDEESRENSEGPPHEVTVAEFYLGRYPVTNEQYGRFLEANPDVTAPQFWNDSRYNQLRQPVVGVSWDDTKRFSEWAGLRLPSEAEWEWACRGRRQTRFCNGNNIEDLERVGWYSGNSLKQLHPVGEKACNAFQLYDMHGNIWEWVEDDWHYFYNGAPRDGGAWVDSPRVDLKINRGGAWDSAAGFCRSACRRAWLPGYRDGFIGFRLAKSIK